MNRALPVDIRKSLEMADELAKAGISFIPIPITSEEERAHLIKVMVNRLDSIEKGLGVNK